MKRLEEYIYEQQIEEQLNEVYDTFLNEDPINEGIIRNALRRAWEWIKSKFRLRRRKSSPYMSDYLARHAEDAYEPDDTRYENNIKVDTGSIATIKTNKTVDKLLNNSKLKDKLDSEGQVTLGSEIYDEKNKMCGILVYTPYKVKKDEHHLVILGLECLKFDDPGLLRLLKEMAYHKYCKSPMYVAKTEYLQNKSYYDNQKFNLVDEKNQTNLFYAYKDY